MFSRFARRNHDRSISRNFNLLPDTPLKPVFSFDKSSRVPRQLRNKKFILSLAIFLVFLGTLYLRSGILIGANESNSSSYPSTYLEFYEQERALPQHNASLSFPEGENGRFMWISNQIWGMLFYTCYNCCMAALNVFIEGLGWNNAFQAL